LISSLQELKDAGVSIESRARALDLEHGIAIGLELFSCCELAQLDLQFEYRLLAEVLENNEASNASFFARKLILNFACVQVAMSCLNDTAHWRRSSAKQRASSIDIRIATCSIARCNRWRRFTCAQHGQCSVDV
jgi:hypothetical protein